MPWGSETESLTYPGGQLRIAWSARGDAGRGTVFLLQGRGELMEKYRSTAAWLEEVGHAVIGLDWRGQGGSSRVVPDPGRGHIDDFDQYLDDLDRLVARAEELRLPRPWAFLGHSMGGHIALRWIAERGASIDRLVMVTPMLDLELRPVPRAVGRGLVHAAAAIGLARAYAPGQRGPERPACRFDGNLLTSCPERFAEWRSLAALHPERLIGGVTWGWLAAALRSIALTERPGVIERLSMPTLVLLAEEEAIVSNAAIEAFARRHPRARLARLPGARHDLLWERAATLAVVKRAILDHLEVENG